MYSKNWFKADTKKFEKKYVFFCYMCISLYKFCISSNQCYMDVRLWEKEKNVIKRNPSENTQYEKKKWQKNWRPPVSGTQTGGNFDRNVLGKVSSCQCTISFLFVFDIFTQSFIFWEVEYNM